MTDTHILRFDPLQHGGEQGMVRFVDQLLQTAIAERASDIHCEPFAENYRIRYRIDGVLHTIATLPTAMASSMTSRLKILANMDIAERRLPQDGRWLFNQQQDCRLSSCPVLYGEKIVIRLLNNQQQVPELSTLGFSEQQYQVITSMLKQSQGLILVTGPTGSGKTLTLYSVLKQFNAEQRNITTVEDPIEMELSGINQVAIHPKVGLDFASVLKAFLRQDPDIIMVGEIRDAETADIAIKAAQTGHWVLATVHTQSAFETVNRLHNMGIERYLIANSLSLIINQRLLRRLCVHCKRPIHLSETLAKQYHLPESGSYYEAVGCEHCHEGYCGRIGVFELLKVNAALQNRLLEPMSAVQWEQYYRDHGYRSLSKVAHDAVMSGTTTLDEALRIMTE